MSPPNISLILPSATVVAAVFPPKSLKSPPIPPPTQRKHFTLLQHSTSRRKSALLLPIISLIPFLHPPLPVAAFSLGISGPKDWLREQKKKSSRFVLAPIDASRNSLQAAYLLLTNSSESNENDQEEVQKLLTSAARDCVPQDRNSFVSFQSKTGVEVCTFQLVLNNASSLMEKNDPLKLDAEAKLNDLVRSLSSLNSVANETGIQFGSNRQKVADGLMDAIASLNKFEQFDHILVSWKIDFILEFL